MIRVTIELDTSEGTNGDRVLHIANWIASSLGEKLRFLDHTIIRRIEVEEEDS